MSNTTFEDEVGRISGEIDQITVQKIFKKLATGNKMRDDALWALTSEAAREIRQLVKGDILAAHAASEAKAVEEARREVAERIRAHASAGPANTIDRARILTAVDEALGEGIYAQLSSPTPAVMAEGCKTCNGTGTTGHTANGWDGTYCPECHGTGISQTEEG